MWMSFRFTDTGQLDISIWISHSTPPIKIDFASQLFSHFQCHCLSFGCLQLSPRACEPTFPSAALALFPLFSTFIQCGPSNRSVWALPCKGFHCLPANSSASPLSTTPPSHVYSFSALRETVCFLFSFSQGHALSFLCT